MQVDYRDHARPWGTMESQDIYRKNIFYISSRTFSDFVCLWALGVFYLGQKTGGRLTKILPARQTHFVEFVCQPFGETTFSQQQKTRNGNSNFNGNILWLEGS